ncbi:DUF3310 domain-containing protein [Stutzerimonas stutzeri]|uniref:DUF3310 domain-containing protein n=1 Tax=Stutzerimonas stutzeri TaxID=316 RepID=UPI000C9D13A2|nr:DUF3310 domain-containing protein [Stutzerimonas stutzeri]PNG11888.1 hypothetical protein CXK97_19385 [Stutzerimonas stutzeri]
MTDAINPTHYTRGGVECIDAIESATVDKRGIEAACTANVIKYLWRYEAKNGLEDVKKARWYLERLIAHLDKAEFGQQNTIDYRRAASDADRSHEMLMKLAEEAKWDAAEARMDVVGQNGPTAEHYDEVPNE